jgi:hypothetical protein
MEEDFNLTTLKIVIDYLHRLRDDDNSEKHDELIHDLTKVVRVIKHCNKHHPNWRKCPHCEDSKYTIKFRDEMTIDGMLCQHCNITWNVDWENYLPLYETVTTHRFDGDTI